MKKIFGLSILLMMTFVVFAKDIPLQVTQTDWGFEISNLDAKGKRICKGFLNFQEQENVFIVFKTNKDSFSTEKLANEIVYNKTPSIIALNGEAFSAVAKDKKTQMYGPLLNYDSILVLTSAGKIEECSAYSDGKNLQLKFSGIKKDTETPLEQLIKACAEEKARIEAEKKAEEERLAMEEAEKKKAIENNWVYDHMPWGTPVSDFLIERSGIKQIENEGVIERYTRDGSGDSVMTYKFYDGKLLGGVTVYNLHGDDAETKGNDINQRMKELYGDPTNVKETSEHKVVTVNFLGSHRIAYTEKHLKVTWNKSPSFKILLDVCVLIGDTKKDTFNICMYITTNLQTFTINYENPSMTKKIAEANAKLEKEQAEAKKIKEEAEKRKRLDDLDL